MEFEFNKLKSRIETRGLFWPNRISRADRPQGLPWFSPRRWQQPASGAGPFWRNHSGVGAVGKENGTIKANCIEPFSGQPSGFYKACSWRKNSRGFICNDDSDP